MAGPSMSSGARSASAGRLAPQGGQQGGLLDMLTPMLDSDRDGSIADDVLGMLGKTFGR
jgi:hypothetical protein